MLLQQRAGVINSDICTIHILRQCPRTAAHLQDPVAGFDLQSLCDPLCGGLDISLGFLPAVICVQVLNSAFHLPLLGPYLSPGP